MTEIDYGSHWTASPGSRDKHLVAYVESTGEIYTVNLHTQSRLRLCRMNHEATEQVDLLMQGWENKCRQPGSLNWVLARARLVGETPMVVYPSLREFYNEDVDGRLRSGEADYGCHWNLGQRGDTWRMSYVRNTGEIYVIRNGGRPEADNSGDNPVFVLGTIQQDPETPEHRERQVYYRTLEAVLEGWPRECLNADGLAWARQRILEHSRNKG